MTNYRSRRQEGVLKQSLATFPCVVLTGPRQSGKTTLVHHLLGDSHRYLSLDEPDVRLRAQQDPRLFLEQHTPPLIIDEVQHVPELLPYIKARVDRQRDRYGQYVLTGSQVFPLMAGVTESLAGRAAVHTLLSMSWGERMGVPRSAALANPSLPTLPDLSVEEVAASALRGGFPELALRSDLAATTWYGSYLQTYLERDVRQMRHVADLEEFQRFLRALAARHGQLLNMAELGRDLGLSLNTVKAWISVLVASHQVLLVRSYHRNMGKRLVKMPRIYFLDGGLVCYLTGMQTTTQWLNGPLAGPLLEGEVLAELVKLQFNRGELPALYTWRTSSGQEVDFIVESGGRPWPIEVKCAVTLKSAMTAAIRSFRVLFPDSGEGRLVYLGREAQVLADGVTALPFLALTGW
ncbi:MAG: ATP-binding protein [bacterium]